MQKFLNNYVDQMYSFVPNVVVLNYCSDFVHDMSNVDRHIQSALTTLNVVRCQYNVKSSKVFKVARHK